MLFSAAECENHSQSIGSSRVYKHHTRSLQRGACSASARRRPQLSVEAFQKHFYGIVLTAIYRKPACLHVRARDSATARLGGV
jgi:hypothetical protein